MTTDDDGTVGDEDANLEDEAERDARRATDEDDVGSDARGDSRQVEGRLVRGVDVDAETRCGHYATDRDVIAIRFACCGTFYPCHACHAAVADHDARQWPADSFDEPAVLCGVCGETLAIATYLDCDDVCPVCDHEFNPGCSTHADRYFDVADRYSDV